MGQAEKELWCGSHSEGHGIKPQEFGHPLPGCFDLLKGSWLGKTTSSSTWNSKRAQNNGPISQNRDCRQYRVHYFGHFGGPGRLKD